MRFGKIFIFALALFMLGVCSQSSAIEIGQKAPEFSLSDINGKTASLSDFKGKVIILDFFATWCPPCRKEVPDFVELQKSYGDKEFAMIGIALVKAADARAFADKMNMNYPVLVDDGKVSNLYGPIRSIPTTFVLDKNGNIVKMYIGYRAKSAFEADIKELMK